LIDFGSCHPISALLLTVRRGRGVLEDVKGTADDLVDTVEDRITKY
jgi:hypothetical protein